MTTPGAVAVPTLWESVASVQAAALLLATAGDSASARCEHAPASRFYHCAGSLTAVGRELRLLAISLDGVEARAAARPDDPVAALEALLGPVGSWSA
jgi:hypothetical protein